MRQAFLSMIVETVVSSTAMFHGATDKDTDRRSDLLNRVRLYNSQRREISLNKKASAKPSQTPEPAKHYPD